MLPWLRKKWREIPERNRLLAQVIGISGLAHGILGVIILCIVYCSSSMHIIFRTSKDIGNAKIVLVPMQRHIQQQPTKMAARATAGTVPIKTSAKVAVPVAKKQATKGTTQLAAQKTSVTKKTAQKKIIKKPVAQSVSKKATPLVPAKQPEPVQPVKIEQEPKVVPSAMENENIIYVGRDDIAQLRIQQMVHETLQEHWRPPSGLSDQAQCSISFIVDGQGKAQEILVTKTSRIPLYDIAARTALLQATFDKMVWGKKCTITFTA